MEASPATITPAPTTYQPEPYPPIFLLGARPLSLDGHIFTQTVQDDGRYRFRIDCPTANVSTDLRTPEDDAGDQECRRADLFPAEVYNELGLTNTGLNVWGGTFTPSAAPPRTWRCEMPMHFVDSLATETRRFAAGNCSQWTSATGSSASAAPATTTVSLDRCDMLRSRVPLRLTGAGREGTSDHGSGDVGFPLRPALFNAWLSYALSSLGCPDPTSLLGFALPSSTGTGSATETGLISATTGSATAASGSVESRSGRARPGVLVCVALVCVSMVAGLL